ncbi:xylose isomerase domain-containing protein [Fimbriimonas ginsengisoli Gsoil 348]|uniref:Xylose isomerase domain-containing protein n=1 Tax=Fimbriimonas ginsengisoli Gsoil 348 TaxID=661478 RepID=A0A068NVS7_FIMGI|nr:xylose isomerase domain-containing protein [Fimbriimonas ginsengisoli Gsoil 348]
MPNPAEFAAAAREADLLIAEVGIWNNPLSPDPQRRKEAVEKCKERLVLADLVGARCCVNIAGSLGERWDGPDPRDVTPEAFHAIVETVRNVIDAVKPTRAKYSIETMPYMVPDGWESSLDLVKAIDRPAFGIHFDPVNIVNSPRRFFDTGGLVREFVDKVGPHITAVHLKDIVLEPRLTVHLQEVRPGLGRFDIAACLRAIHDGLDADMPVLIEHLPSEEEYKEAAAHVRMVAEQAGVPL